MLLKLGMSKAYDREEWDYLEYTLHALGFPDSLIKLVMICIKTASFSFLINATPKGLIIPSRGIRQDDPLSPYLFFLCMEGLVSLLEEIALENSLQGIRVCRGAPSMNHPLFADDSLIFCKADSLSSQKILNIISQYAKALGQCINTEKTTMVFSRNAKREIERK